MPFSNGIIIGVGVPPIQNIFFALAIANNIIKPIFKFRHNGHIFSAIGKRSCIKPNQYYTIAKCIIILDCAAAINQTHIIPFLVDSVW